MEADLMSPTQCSSSHALLQQIPVDPFAVPDENNSWNVDNWNNEVYKFEQDSLIKNKLGLIINKRYQIVQRIDAGAFGSTYIGEDLKKNRERVAVKFDTGDSDWKKSKREENHLKYEFEVYKSALYDDGIENVDGFARVFWFGYQYGHNILVMELLGASVASLFNFCDRKFGWRTVLSLAEQMICRIRHIHQRGFIHRDLKPENFLMGLGKKETTCYLIDFGLARRYRFRHLEDRTLKHIPFRRGRSFIGTAKYASVNSHRSVELSRRDDLESIGYVLIELINGNLPWRNICRRNQNNRHHSYMRIRIAKEQANWLDICPPMADYMHFCRQLQFAEEPDYEKLLINLRKRFWIEERQSVAVSQILVLKCEDCRALNTNNDVREKVEDIKEEQNPMVSTLFASQASNMANIGDRLEETTIPQQNFSYAFLPNNCYSFRNDVNNLTRRMNNINLMPANSLIDETSNYCDRRSFFTPHTQPFALTPFVKFSQPSVDNISQHSSLENIKSNLSTRTDITSPTRQGNSEALLDEYTRSMSWCQNCRLHRKNCFDEEITPGDVRLSWQLWRDLTPENRFNYANRFSWTLPVTEHASMFSTHQHRLPNLYQPPANAMIPPSIPLQYNQQLCQYHSSPYARVESLASLNSTTSYAVMPSNFYQRQLLRSRENPVIATTPVLYMLPTPDCNPFVQI